MSTPRILVTNDDGIESVGLHKLARAMVGLGEVIVVAPDQEYSGAGAAIGALHIIEPECTEAEVEGIDTAWSVTGPPALCVLFARMGAFGPMPDLIVSGINPGANVGRAVYHSGTVGACLTGRNGAIPGLAVSQQVDRYDVSGQGLKDMLANQKWDTAATLARACAEPLLDGSSFPDAGVLNLNVPNLTLDELAGWKWTEIAGAEQAHDRVGDQFRGKATLESKEDDSGTYKVNVAWNGREDQADGTDANVVDAGYASVTWISRLTALGWDTPTVDAALDDVF